MATATRVIQILRNFLAGQDLQGKLWLRYKEISSRSQPPPVLAVGPAHKLSGNAYCERDHRREHAPPQLIYSGHTALQAGTQGPSAGDVVTVTNLKPLTPGDSYVWKLSEDQPYL
uniref:NADH dehydrogenase [ubiquinone] 1 alpha subcomplex subunit 7 n=1 Tax=Myxine glutinosa TaxID=7769 RepID=UPI00358E80CD